jgi:hypothetical protein
MLTRLKIQYNHIETTTWEIRKTFVFGKEEINLSGSININGVFI